jgi:hypothetical protein
MPHEENFTYTKDNEPLAQTPVLTGDIQCSDEVIDSVFAIDSSTGGFLPWCKSKRRIRGSQRQLRQACCALEGDAVIFCLFQYRNAVADGMVGAKAIAGSSHMGRL